MVEHKAKPGPLTTSLRVNNQQQKSPKAAVKRTKISPVPDSIHDDNSNDNNNNKKVHHQRARSSSDSFLTTASSAACALESVYDDEENKVGAPIHIINNNNDDNNNNNNNGNLDNSADEKKQSSPTSGKRVRINETVQVQCLAMSDDEDAGDEQQHPDENEDQDNNNNNNNSHSHSNDANTKAMSPAGIITMAAGEGRHASTNGTTIKLKEGPQATNEQAMSMPSNSPSPRNSNGGGKYHTGGTSNGSTTPGIMGRVHDQWTHVRSGERRVRWEDDEMNAAERWFHRTREFAYDLGTNVLDLVADSWPLTLAASAAVIPSAVIVISVAWMFVLVAALSVMGVSLLVAGGCLVATALVFPLLLFTMGFISLTGGMSFACLLSFNLLMSYLQRQSESRDMQESPGLPATPLATPMMMKQSRRSRGE